MSSCEQQDPVFEEDKQLDLKKKMVIENGTAVNSVGS